MRTLLAVTALVGLTAAVGAQDKKDPPKKPEVTLKVGDPAPPLKATKWLQGTEITGFSPGKVYVVEFWATWCGPCIVMMPHMSDMQEEYKDKGVTFVGFTAKDPNNSQEKVVQFVQKRGPKLKYSFAYADDRATYDAYMRAAGQGGIPCSYVVDQKGRIAYIGHPMFLDIVLPKVVQGEWTEADVKNLAKVESEVDAVFETFGRPNAEDAIKALAQFDEKYPKLAGIPYFTGQRINLLLRTKKFDEAKAMAESVIDKALKQEDPMALRTVASVMRSAAAKEHKELLALAVKAAEAQVKVAGEDDALALVSLADTYFVAGDKEKARATGEKALKAAENESAGLKNYVANQVKKFTEDKKEKK